MSSRIAILTDTNSGIMGPMQEELGVWSVPMPVIVDGKTYYEGVSIDQAQFLALLRTGAKCTTSQPSPGDLAEFWDRLLQDHDKVVYIPMTSGLTGGVETAKGLALDYDGRVLVADNRRISEPLRHAVMEAKYLADRDCSAEEIVRFLEEDARNASIYLTVSTLEYLKRSGRVTPAGAAIGTFLRIKPVLQIQGEKLDAYRKVRGMRAAVDTMLRAAKYDIENRFAGQKVVVQTAYSGSEEKGERWRQTVQAAFPDYTVDKAPLSVSISCHTGEGALGVAVVKTIL